MAIDRTRLFDHIRRPLFDGRLSQGQVSGIEAVIDRFEAVEPDGDGRFLAYMLATAHHETGRRMQPVRETFAETDAAAVARLDRAFAAGRLPAVTRPYWRPDAGGRSWFGRGFVQLTHRGNYERMSALTGIDLVADPARAMALDVSAAILVDGMRAGAFTGRRLAHYFDGTHCDWTGARRIINGLDRAALVAGYGRAYFAAVSAAGVGASGE